MSHPEPYEGESRLEQLRYSIILAVSMLIPPIHSLERIEATCKRLIAKNPKALTPRSFLADTYRIYDKNEAACFEYEELCKLAPMPALDRIRFAEVLYRLKDFVRVIEVSESVVAERPKEKNANGFLAMSFMELGLHDRAATYFRRTITAGNRRYEDFWRLGFCLVKAGQLNEALMAYNQGLVVNPASKELRRSVVWVESKLRQVSDVKLAAGSSIHGNGTPPQPPSS